MREISIIIPTYNNQRGVELCLKSVDNQTYDNFRVVIVDNNSTDGTVREIESYLKNHQELSKKTKIVKNDFNLGFAKAVNIGIKESMKKRGVFAVLLLNQDAILDKNTLKDGLDVLKRNEVGACAPKIQYSDKRIWWAGTRLFTAKELVLSLRYGIGTHIKKGEVDTLPANHTFEIEALTGCAMFIKTEAIKKIGLFNEKYFMYAEDIDYSLRLRSNGYKLMLFTNSPVIHDQEDRKKTIKQIISGSKKYKIYLTSIALYLLDYFPFYIFLLWTLKLPISLMYNYLRQKNANS